MVKQEQEQEQTLDKPISTPDPAAGSPRPGMSEPAEQRRQGAMGERRVSESPPDARLLPVSVSEGAGGIAGGAGRPPRPPEQVEDSFAAYRRMRCLYNQYIEQSGSIIKVEIQRVDELLKRFVRHRFEKLGGEFTNLPRFYGGVTKAEQAYMSLQEEARQADSDGNPKRASAIRVALVEIDRHVAAELKKLCDTYGLAEPSFTPAPPQPPPMAAPTFDWCLAFRQLTHIRQYFDRAGRLDDAAYFRRAVDRLESRVKYRFGKFCPNRATLHPLHSGYRPRTEQKYRTLQDMDRRIGTARDGKATRLHRAMEEVNSSAQEELSLLTRKYGPLQDLAARAGLPPQRALPGAAPIAAAAPSSGSPRPEAGAAAVPTIADLYSAPPGPSPRVMPPQAPRTPPAPAPEVPLAQRKAIVERFRSDEALLYAGFSLGNSGSYVLGWTATRSYRVLDDLYRLHRSAQEDTEAAAALADIDWSGIEAMAGTLDIPSPSSSPSPSPSPSP